MQSVLEAGPSPGRSLVGLGREGSRRGSAKGQFAAEAPGYCPPRHLGSPSSGAFPQGSVKWVGRLEHSLKTGSHPAGCTCAPKGSSVLQQRKPPGQRLPAWRPLRSVPDQPCPQEAVSEIPAQLLIREGSLGREEEAKGVPRKRGRWGLDPEAEGVLPRLPSSPLWHPARVEGPQLCSEQPTCHWLPAPRTLQITPREC